MKDGIKCVKMVLLIESLKQFRKITPVAIARIEKILILLDIQIINALILDIYMIIVVFILELCKHVLLKNTSSQKLNKQHIT